MTTRPSRRLVRVALAASGLGLAALTVAPGALAASSSSRSVPDYAGTIVPPPPSSGTVVPPKAPVKHHVPVKHVTHSSTSTLAYTGAEVGGAAALGLVLVAGGAVMVRGARRPAATA